VAERTQLDDAEARARLKEALDALVRCDLYLLVHDLSERCIASRLAYHLQGLFPEYSVDVEYNRAGAIPKRAAWQDREGNDEDLIIPDIVVHRRGLEGPNILCLEVKKAEDRRGSAVDHSRIKALRRAFGYSCGALVVCHTGTEAGVEISEWVDTSAN
jgi:hypothetical protein